MIYNNIIKQEEKPKNRRMSLNAQSLSDNEISELGKSIFDSIDFQKTDNSTYKAKIEVNLTTKEFSACRDENGKSMIIISPNEKIHYQIAHLSNTNTILISLNNRVYNHYVIFAVNNQIINSYDDYISICGKEKSFTLSLVHRFDPGYAEYVMGKILSEKATSS